MFVFSIHEIYFIQNFDNFPVCRLLYNVFAPLQWWLFPCVPFWSISWGQPSIVYFPLLWAFSCTMKSVLWLWLWSLQGWARFISDLGTGALVCEQQLLNLHILYLLLHTELPVRNISTSILRGITCQICLIFVNVWGAKCMQSLNPDIWIYHLTAIAKYDGCETFERHDCSADTMIHLGVQAETRKLLQTETLLQVLWTTLQTSVDKEVGDSQCVWLASGLDLSRTRRRFVTTCSDLSDSKLRFVAAFTSCLSLLTDSLVVRCHYEQVQTHVCYSVCRAGISFPGDIWIWIFARCEHRAGSWLGRSDTLVTCPTQSRLRAYKHAKGNRNAAKKQA